MLFLRSMTRFLVIFCRSLRSAVSDGLSLSGYVVYEALAVSEVLHLCEHENNDRVVIAPEVIDEAARVVAEHSVTLRLRREATAADILWELSQLFSHQARIQ